MPKLKPEIKKLWCDALRSGEWQQTTEKLEWENAYCCLGVLTKLTGEPMDLERDDEIPPPALAETWWDLSGPASMFAELRDPEVKIDVEEFDEDGEEVLVSRSYNLSEVNDKLNYTFAQIADLIEEQL